MLLHTSTPGKLGIPPKAISDFIDDVNARELGLHSFILLRHGQIASQAWWKPYDENLPHQLYSLSKSFTSTAVGFAVQEGLLKTDDKVVSFFPEELTNEPCGYMKNLTVRNLLCMGTGHTREPLVFLGEKWTNNFLTSYIQAEPESVFTYNTPATYMLSRIVQKVTGRTLTEYLTPRLFEPLGIENHRWLQSPEGTDIGGYGLNLKTTDIAKFGQFLLNRGNVNGKQILNAEWIDLATSVHISNGNPEEDNDWTQGYGFQFWKCKPEGVYRGDGAFGQYCVVMPKQDAVLAITSGSANIREILKSAWKHLLPAMQSPVPDDGLEALNEKIAFLSIPMPEGGMPKACCEETYVLSDNKLGIEKISVEHKDGKASLNIDIAANAHAHRQPDPLIAGAQIPFGYGHWLEAGEKDYHTMGAYAENESGEIIFRFILVETPFIREIIYKPHGDFAEFTVRQNVGFFPINMYLIGKKQ